MDLYKCPVPSTSHEETPSTSKLDEHSYSLKGKSSTPSSDRKGKKPTATKRLEVSQKMSNEMLKSMETRTSIMEEYYNRKIKHMENIEMYKKRKLRWLKGN